MKRKREVEEDHRAILQPRSEALSEFSGNFNDAEESRGITPGKMARDDFIGEYSIGPFRRKPLDLV